MSSEKCIQPQGHQDNPEEHTLSDEIFYLMKHKNRKWAFWFSAIFVCALVYLGCSAGSAAHTWSSMSMFHCFVYVFCLNCIYVHVHWYAYDPVHVFVCVCLHVLGVVLSFLQSCTGFLRALSGGPQGQVCGCLWFISGVKLRQPPLTHHSTLPPIPSLYSRDGWAEAMVEERGLKRLKRR